MTTPSSPGTRYRRSQREWRLIAGELVLVVVILASAGGIVWSLSSGTRAGTSTSRTSASTTLPAVTAPPTSLPSSTTTTPKQGYGALEGSISQYLQSRTGTISVAVENLQDGRLITVGSSTPQDEASIVKVDILETLLSQLPAGAVLPANQESTAASMIEESDNTSATELWDAVGSAPGIAAYNQLVGLRDTSPSPCVQCSGFPWPGWGLTKTTAADQIALLKQIALPNQELTDAQRLYIRELMQEIVASQAWGVMQGLPPGVTVAFKNGWLPLNDADTIWQVNGIGWVDGAGADYLIAVLTTGDPNQDYGEQTIGQISTLVWQGLTS